MGVSSFVMLGLLLATCCNFSYSHHTDALIVENSESRIRDLLNSDRVTTGKGIMFPYRVNLLQTIFDAFSEAGLENSVEAAKTVFLAKELLKSDETVEGSAEFVILQTILQNSTIFAKNFANGFSCRIPEDKAKSSLLKKNFEDEKQMLFYIADNFGRVSKSKYETKPDGDMLMIKVNSGNVVYLMDNGDYPEFENILTGANSITSTKIIGKTEGAGEDIAAESLQEWFCFPISAFFKVPNNELEL